MDPTNPSSAIPANPLSSLGQSLFNTVAGQGGDVDVSVPERLLAQLSLFAAVNGNVDVVPQLQQLAIAIDQGDEATGKFLDYLAENPNFVRQNGGQMAATAFQGATGFETERLGQQLDSYQRWYNLMVSRDDRVQNMVLAPLEMQSTFSSIGAGIGQILQMAASAGLIDARYGELGEQLIENAETFAEEVEARREELSGAGKTSALDAAEERLEDYEGAYRTSELISEGLEVLGDAIENGDLQLATSQEELAEFLQLHSAAIAEGGPEAIEGFNTFLGEMGVDGIAIGPNGEVVFDEPEAGPSPVLAPEGAREGAVLREELGFDGGP